MLCTLRRSASGPGRRRREYAIRAADADTRAALAQSAEIQRGKLWRWRDRPTQHRPPHTAGAADREPPTGASFPRSFCGCGDPSTVINRERREDLSRDAGSVRAAVPFFQEDDQHDLGILSRRITGKPGMRPWTFVSHRGPSFARNFHRRIRLGHVAHAVGNGLLQACKNWGELAVRIAVSERSQIAIAVQQLQRSYADSPLADSLQLQFLR